MEEDGSDIVEVAVQREQASPSLIGPDLDFVVVTARDEEGLRVVEVDSSHRTIVLFESINQRSHPVVPQLNGAGVERDKNPWSSSRLEEGFEVERGRGVNKPLGVEGNALRPRRLGFELVELVSI